MGIVFSLFCCDLFLFFVLFPGIIIIISSFKKEKEKGVCNQEICINLVLEEAFL